MGWLWLVGSIKLWVSFAKEPCKRDNTEHRTQSTEQHQPHTITTILCMCVRGFRSHTHTTYEYEIICGVPYTHHMCMVGVWDHICVYTRTRTRRAYTYTPINRTSAITHHQYHTVYGCVQIQIPYTHHICVWDHLYCPIHTPHLYGGDRMDRICVHTRTHIRRTYTYTPTHTIFRAFSPDKFVCPHKKHKNAINL